MLGTKISNVPSSKKSILLVTLLRGPHSVSRLQTLCITKRLLCTRGSLDVFAIEQSI